MDLIRKYDTPHRLHLETTKRCNLLCEHCYVSASDKYEDHDINTLKSIMLKTKEKGASRITFTGGEFLMRMDYRELIQYAVDVGYRNIYFITNGIYLTAQTLAWLAALKVRESVKSALPVMLRKKQPITIGIGISLDGIKGNELIRKYKNKRPVFPEKILRRIAMATQYGLYVTVNTTICNATTASELYSMYEILLKYNVDRWQVDMVFMSGRSAESQAVEDKDRWMPTAKKSFYKIIKHYLQNYPHNTSMKLEIVQLFRSAILDHGFDIIKNDNHHPCDYQFGSVVVEEGATVRFCPSLRFAGDGIFTLNHGELSSESYSNNINFSEFARITVANLPCKDCRYKYIAHGGCRGNSMSYSQRLYAKDPVCCALSPFIEESIIPLMSEQLQEQYRNALFLEGQYPDAVC